MRRVIPDDVKRAIGFEPLPHGRDLKGERDGNEKGAALGRAERLRDPRDYSLNLAVGLRPIQDASEDAP